VKKKRRRRYQSITSFRACNESLLVNRNPGPPRRVIEIQQLPHPQGTYCSSTYMCGCGTPYGATRRNSRRSQRPLLACAIGPGRNMDGRPARTRKITSPRTSNPPRLHARTYGGSAILLVARVSGGEGTARHESRCTVGFASCAP
jgi:hypothetical protein